MFETDENILHSLDNDHKSADQFEINGQQYILDKNDADNTHASNTSTHSLPHTCNLDLQKLKQLQQQDENNTKLIPKCKSSASNETPYHWMSMVLYTEKSEMDPIFFMLLWFPIPCNPIFYMSATMHWT